MRHYKRPVEQPDDPYQTQPLPVEQPVAVYYRQSTEAQIGNVSTTLQTVDMVEHLARLGWSPEQIIMVDMDAGISGMTTIDERPGMSQLYQMIETQAIGAVAAQDVDRFFRDMTQIQPNIFIDACRRNRILVLTPTMVYDFGHATQGRYHMQMFREQAQRAADYLEFHIKGRLVKSRNWRKERGLWTGRWVAAGYIVDQRETLPDGTPNPRQDKYAPFKPYADVIRAYFELFREKNGSVAHTWQHIQEHGPFFPEFDEEMVPPGFTFRTRLSHRSEITGQLCPAKNSLSQYLTNVVYIGHWIHQRAIVQWDNHPPLVPLDLFMYAFNRLSKTDFFGDPNPDYRPYRQFKRHPKSERSEPYPIYAGLLFSDDLPHKPHQRLSTVWNAHGETYLYSFYEPNKRSNIWTIRAHLVDPVVDQLLLERLQATTLDERMWQAALADSREGNKSEIKRQETIIKRAKQEQANLIAALSHLTSEEMIRRAEAKYEAAARRIEVMEEELRQARQTQHREKVILQSRPALQKIAANWERVPRHERRTLFESLAHHIKLSRLGRYDKRITIHWRDGSQTARHIRTSNSLGKYWRQAELNDLREIIEAAVDQIDILRAYPDYTWRQLMERYAYHFTPDNRYGGVYQGHKPYPNKTRWADTQEYLAENQTSQSCSDQCKSISCGGCERSSPPRSGSPAGLGGASGGRPHPPR